MDLGQLAKQDKLIDMIESLKAIETEECHCDDLGGIQRCRSCRAASILNDIQSMALSELIALREGQPE